MHGKQLDTRGDVIENMFQNETYLTTSQEKDQKNDHPVVPSRAGL